MPTAFYGPLGPIVTYDQRDIDEMVRSAKRPDMKYSLTDEGEYGHCRLHQHAQNYLCQDFTTSPFFKIQHKSYSDWTTETSITYQGNRMKFHFSNTFNK